MSERCPCGEDTPEGCAKRPTRHCGAFHPAEESPADPRDAEIARLRAFARRVANGDHLAEATHPEAEGMALRAYRAAMDEAEEVLGSEKQERPLGEDET